MLTVQNNKHLKTKTKKKGFGVRGDWSRTSLHKAGRSKRAKAGVYVVNHRR